MINKVSILIPVYNEEKYLDKLLQKVINAPALNLQKEIIVINDGSSDNTKKILTKWEKKNIARFYIINRTVNKGKGNALKIGLQKSTGDIIIFQDSDLEYNPNDYQNLLTPFINKKVLAVYGSRTLGINKFGNHYSSLLFYTGGKILTLLMNILYKANITDQPTGYKLIHKKLSRIICQTAKENDFSFEIEMTAILNKKKIKIHEVPIYYYPRSVSDGKKINLTDFFKSIFIAFKYYLFYQP